MTFAGALARLFVVMLFCLALLGMAQLVFTEVPILHVECQNHDHPLSIYEDKPYTNNSYIVEILPAHYQESRNYVYYEMNMLKRCNKWMLPEGHTFLEDGRVLIWATRNPRWQPRKRK